MATIKDVARLAGVGVGTASRAISGRGPVSADALARVEQAVKVLDFKPSSIARALSLSTLGMIGVYVPYFGSTFYGPLLQAVDEALRAQDKHMVAANGCGHGDARQQALDGIDFLIDKQCDGLVILSNDLRERDFTDIARRFPRIVVVNRTVSGLVRRCFSTDHALGGRLVAQALLARGHREIALISGPHQAPDNEARLAGFLDELAKAGVEVPASRRVDGDFDPASGTLAADALMRGRRPRALGFTAVFAANDVMATAAISRFNDHGVRVPQDLSVIGFDDAELASYTTPRLTTVRIPVGEAAVNAARFLINECFEADLPVRRDFPPALVWRASVGPGPHPPVAFDGMAPPPPAFLHAHPAKE